MFSDYSGIKFEICNKKINHHIVKNQNINDTEKNS